MPGGGAEDIWRREKEDPIRGSECVVYRIALFTRYELSISRDRELPLAVGDK